MQSVKHEHSRGGMGACSLRKLDTRICNFSDISQLANYKYALLVVLQTFYTMYQTWGQVHEYLYLSTLKYRFESTCTLLKYFLISPNVLVLILKYFAKYLYVLEYF